VERKETTTGILWETSKMITRIEIDGFKSFENFSIDFSPFSAIVGPNASGKSNLFDAIQLVSQLSKKDIRSALLDLRGEPEELFRKSGSGTREKLRYLLNFFCRRMEWIHLEPNFK
jgi:AAA15 family ATPase/GTPase